MASNASATATIRASSGIDSPARPSGTPRPSKRSWWERTTLRIIGASTEERREDAPAEERVRHDVLVLLVGERPGLVEHRLAHADLADVVHVPAQLHWRTASGSSSSARAISVE
jgi:hypothetical protein